MKTIVVGTAGHIDHGKTALVRAMTGIDCDRLKEEKERGITTELGFAHHRFGDELMLGIVDVPGHEKFVRHMVAGAWGIDMVLLVVAADEGVMPQTREHVDICEILGLKRGIVVITKKDLVDDDMVELVREDVRDLLKGRPLEDAPVVAVSSATGENIGVLRDLILRESLALKERSREGIFRLPVDRVFTIRGLGTIVTGTCISGAIGLGDEVEVFPLNRFGKVRNVQAYHQDVQEASAGQRVALNLQGLDRGEIERGTIIGRRESLLLTDRVDATLRYLKLPLKPIRTDSILRFHVATTQVEARLVILAKDTIEPGEEAFVQFVFSRPIVVLPGDGFVIRGSYAIQTIGGGTILDISPVRHRRKSPDLAGPYHILTRGTILERIEYHVAKGGYEGLKTSRLALLLGLEEKTLAPSLKALADLGKIRLVGRIAMHGKRAEEYRARLLALLEEFHRQNPQKTGISREELRSRLPKAETATFQAVLDECVLQGTVEVEKDRVRSKGFGAGVQGERSLMEDKILGALSTAGLTPPSVKELAAQLGFREPPLKDALERLVFEGKLAKVKGEIYFHRDIMEGIKEQVVRFLREHGKMAPADFKGMVNVSRKYMIPILEYLDETKLTIRTGDMRVLRAQ